MAIGVRLVLLVMLGFVAGCSGVLKGAGFGPIKTSVGSCSPDPCIAVDIAGIPQLPKTVSPVAKTLIESELRRVLYAPLDVDTNELSRESIIRELNERLQEYEVASDTSVDWSLTRTASVLFSDAKITSCEVTNEGYLGGAHGFNERTLMTFDSESGQRLGVHDLVSEQSQQMFNKIVEAEFRRARSISSGQTLQDAGFFILPGQELPLGENFALSSSGLEIQYNPYEVAPYSMGETRVRVPPEAIAPLVKAELQEVFRGKSVSEVTR